ALTITTVMIVSANLKGRWLPALMPPLLTNFYEVADQKFDYDPKTDMIPFGRAFPQDPEMFLINKIKVNLRRTSGHPNPMGAFEIYLQVDARDTAVELQTRQVEIHDQVQRIIEEQSYNEMVSDLGKNRVKGIIKSQVSQALTQGYVVDVHFKNFILKP